MRSPAILLGRERILVQVGGPYVKRSVGWAGGIGLARRGRTEHTAMLLDRNIPVGFILNKVRYDLLLVGVIGGAVYFIKHHFAHVLPEMPIAIPAFIGTAISVILSFKLNQSYDRWWEARKIWGAIVNDSRNLVLRLRALLPEDARADLEVMTRRQMAWCHALGQALRGKPPLAGMERFLSPDELRTVEGHTNRPLALLDLNAQHIGRLREAGRLDAYTAVELSRTITALCDHMGMAERIKTTVFPVTYRLFLHLFIYLFVISLSISLEQIAWYFELPLLLLISSSFLLLEKSAKHLQDPFSNRPTDTAVTAIATTIEINLKQLLGEKDVPAPHAPEKFYLM